MKRTPLKLTGIIAAALLCAAAVTTAVSQEKESVDFNALAAKGEALSNEDPLAQELRNQQPDEALQGFYIGMGVADGHTAPGPGKDRTCASLLPSEQRACSLAVLFSVDRNRNANRASVGAAIARVDSVIAEARNSTTDVFYQLGFDIATGIFGDPTLGAQGNTATGPGSLGIRDSLSAAGKKGFNDSVALNLSRRGKTATNGPSFPANRVNKGPKIGETTPQPEYMEMRCRGYNFVGGGAFVFFNIGTRVSVTGETIVTLEMAFNPAVKAAGADASGLQIGECAFADRALTDKEPYRVRFETVADGQLRQRLNGSTIDNSPTAAERFPDAQNIPEYLKDPNHYWSFFVKNTGRGYFEASHNRFWKPSRKLSPSEINRGIKIVP